MQREGGFTTDYSAFMNHDNAFNHALAMLCSLGIIMIDNVPQEEEAVEHLGERIGPLRHTFYGRTWDVRDKPDTRNVAYTARELPLHMDLL